MNTISKILGAMLALLLVAGCATVNTVEPANPEGHPDKVADKRIITNNTLNEIAYTVEVDKGKTAAGFRIVQVTLRNTKSGVKNITYRFQWFDAHGISLNNDPLTKSLSIEGGDTRTISDIATSLEAVDWRLTLEESVGFSPELQPNTTGGGFRHN